MKNSMAWLIKSTELQYIDKLKFELHVKNFLMFNRTMEKHMSTTCAFTLQYFNSDIMVGFFKKACVCFRDKA
jgi:hypothetical protein